MNANRNALATAAFNLAVVGLWIVFYVAAPVPATSQVVQLVKVDVNVVAEGYRASRLIGSAVQNDKNERIGTIDEIIIGRDVSKDPKQMFAVLQVGGFLGLGGRLVAIPYESLKIDDQGRKIELPGASKEELQKLTEFRYPA
jgi:hypothetical protein